MYIFVKYNTGKTIGLELQPTDTIASAKDKLWDKDSVPVHLQSLVFDGQDLENEKTLGDYNILKEQVIYIEIRKHGDNT